ncbi:uncharacterized protein LOC105435727 [Cucumis sativus]|uniref:Uncharacterized protein n=1 Tax=Cucumis sativus TaxID=3659 RepID=A0A0A0KBD8_CUCSA|nr:uncharacterized protein LOC105435727 [Cucumis sativus]KGN45707.1 hypothetical protein Csa_005527 [Cucumis sativus]
MELRRNWYDSNIWVVFFCLLMLISCSVSFEDVDSFNGFVHKYANNSLSKPRTGIVYNISLPSNFSGIQVSYIRLRSGSFWVRGANLRWISIPPRLTSVPYVKRLAIIFENLGNWSSTFYKIPGYTLVAPVIGFTVYDSSTNSSTLSNKKLHLIILGRKPILVMFPKVENSGKKPQCVKFGANGTYELKNMTGPNFCSATDYGHFSLVIPTPSIEKEEKKKRMLWEWWVVGFGCGLLVLALMVVVLITVLRLVKKKSIKGMEREAERGVSFDNVWIGKSRMPSASMVRTQPSLENSYVP